MEPQLKSIVSTRVAQALLLMLATRAARGLCHRRQENYHGAERSEKKGYSQWKHQIREYARDRMQNWQGAS